MRATVWAGFLAATLIGCGGSSSGPNTGGGGSVGGTTAHVLAIHFAGDGAGAVHSATPPFDCNGSCTQNVTAGASVVLTATAAAGSSFAGWQGACSGTASCTLTLDMDRDVTASFTAIPAGTARITVNPVGKGGGRVTSSPPGIDCPGTCGMTVAQGTSVSLAAQPDGSSSFMGWGGSCSGPASCSFSASGDATVWVDFELKSPPATASCAGIAAPDAPSMMQYVYQPGSSSLPASCGGAAGDGAGTLGLVVNGAHADAVYIVDASGKLLSSTTTTLFGFPLEQPQGVSVVNGRPYLGPDEAVKFGQMLTDFDSAGKKTGVATLANHSGQNNLPAVADPDGGVFLAGDLAMGASDPVVHAAVMFEGGGTSGAVRWGPKALASSGAVFGLGVDLLGRSLVITAGPAGGEISAQWFEKDGSALTGEFTLLTGFSPGSSTWFETTALIGGGLLVRRMDAGPAHSQALVIVSGGSTSTQPAPDWMKARADTRLQIARGGHAYAVLPLGAKGVACSQRVEVVAPDGTSCGQRDYAVAAGNCDTKDLAMGADGTVLQQLPGAMETTSADTALHTCTWRWWPAAAK